MSGWSDKQSAQNITIVSNRSPELLAFSPCARCRFPQLLSPGVRLAQVSGVVFDGEGQAVGYLDGSDGIIQDLDGSLTGITGRAEGASSELLPFAAAYMG